MKKEETDVERKIDILDDMIGALVDLLEEKEVIDGDEWEERLKERLDESKKLKKINDLE